MKQTCHPIPLIIPLIILAMVPAIAAGAGSYWTNQITGPDYSVPESAFNPPDSGEWGAWYGGFASGNQDIEVMPSPYRYGTPGGLLPYDFSDTAPTRNTTPSSGQADPASLYPRAISPLPISPDTIPLPVVPGNFGNDIPSAALLFPYGAGSPVPASIQEPSSVPLVFPPAIIPDTADEHTGEAPVIPTPTPEQGEVVFISDLNVRDEYVKITNNGLTPVTMTGWKIVAGSTRRSITFIDWPQGNSQTFTFTLYPLTTLTVYYGKSGPVTATEAYWPSAKDVWNDAGDTAYLYDPDGRMVSSLSR
jgi:hypothetical protein